LLLLLFDIAKVDISLILPSHYTSSPDRKLKKEFEIAFYICPSAFSSPTDELRRSLFLGLWSGIFPFNVSELSKSVVRSTNVAAVVRGLGGRIVDEDEEDYWDDMDSELEDEEDDMEREDEEEHWDDMERELEAKVLSHQEIPDTFQAKLKLLCSSREKSTEGHVCDDDTSFRGVFKRFFSQQSLFWRRQRQLSHGRIKYTPSNACAMVCGHKDAFFFTHFLEHGWPKYDTSINSALQQIENIGHDSVDQVEGLNCELLDFQRQSLKWALEREAMPGGIQRLYWGKVPTDETDIAKELWFNPLLGLFRRGPPKVIRGGFIAEEMGLVSSVGSRTRIAFFWLILLFHSNPCRVKQSLV